MLIFPRLLVAFQPPKPEDRGAAAVRTRWPRMLAVLALGSEKTVAAGGPLSAASVVEKLRAASGR